MIFVTVGTHTDGFQRLVEAMDRLAPGLDEEVVIQLGATPVQPANARWFRFTTQDEVDDLCRRARLIVSHAGAGSIMAALRYGKPLIVMPRLKKYGEHLDNHQTELARVLADNGTILVAYEAAELPQRLAEAAGFMPRRPDSSCLVEAVRAAVTAR
ncbi:MAG TPA: PssE/Cps14G family polysaccharide biosynthesis glycosyltransferase [Anaerolineae bacterium]